MHPDVQQEQAYFDHALELRERLETNALSARQETDRATARDLRRRVGALGVVDPGVAVAFGRIDADGQQWYIGKGAIWDEDNELVVVNWQAPVAAPFYRAGPDEPEGLDARRIYRCEAGNQIRDIDEQIFAGLEQAVRSGVPPAAPPSPDGTRVPDNGTRPGPASPKASRQPTGRPGPSRPEMSRPVRRAPTGPQARVDTGPTPEVPARADRRRQASPARRPDRGDTGPPPSVPARRSDVSRPPGRPDDDPGGFGQGAAGNRYESPPSADLHPERRREPAERSRPSARSSRAEVLRPGERESYDHGDGYDREVLRPGEAGPNRSYGRPQESYDREVFRSDPGGQLPSRVSHTVEVFRSTGDGEYVRETGSVEVVRLPENGSDPTPAGSPAPDAPTGSDRASRAPVTPPAGTPAVPAPAEAPLPEPAPVAETLSPRVQPVSDTLLDALERARSGELSDIVATIQSSQYDVITRDVDQLLVVQGGPGTGKTVVGLHRVSWILYNRRDAWQPNDILVVGPSDAFVRYISAVLPSLGDDAVVQLPVCGLGPRAEVTRTDSVELRALKGDRRMQRLLLRAIRNRQKPQRGPVELNVAGRTVRLDGDGVVAQARQLAGQPHNEARRALRAHLIDEVQTFFHRRGLRGVAAIGDMAENESTRGVDDYLERIWPAMTPQKFLVDLFAKRRRLEAAGVGLLTGEEIDSLLISPDTRVEDAAWSVDDIALLDLADSFLNGTPVTYEHIVVDEAQDLTPMQFESIRRRSRTGSMTILGDLAQGTTPWSPDSWEEAVLHLRRDRVPTEIAELTIGYRLPQEVHDVAMRLLPEIAPRLREPEAVRATGDRVEVAACHPQDLLPGVVEAVRQQVGTGLVGVIVPGRDHADVGEALTDAGYHWSDRLMADGPSIVVLTAEACRGLEFNSVVVVEPAEIAGESPRGLRALFVAMTRTTGALVLLHSEPLPSALELDSPVPDRPARPPEPESSPWAEHRPDLERLPEPVFEGLGPASGNGHGGHHNGHGQNGHGGYNGHDGHDGRGAPDGRDGRGGDRNYLDYGVDGDTGDYAAHRVNGDHGTGRGGPADADPWAPRSTADRDQLPSPSTSLVARNSVDEMQRYDDGSHDAAAPAGHGPPEPNAMERAMARAIASELTDALGRYVTPALAPLVLEEMRQALAERFPPGSELPPGSGAEQLAVTCADQPPGPPDRSALEAAEPDRIVDIRR